MHKYEVGQEVETLTFSGGLMRWLPGRVVEVDRLENGYSDVVVESAGVVSRVRVGKRGGNRGTSLRPISTEVQGV